MERTLTNQLRAKVDLFSEMYLHGVRTVHISKDFADDLLTAINAHMAYPTPTSENRLDRMSISHYAMESSWTIKDLLGATLYNVEIVGIDGLEIKKGKKK